MQISKCILYKVTSEPKIALQKRIRNILHQKRKQVPEFLFSKIMDIKGGAFLAHSW